jgi:hypothetical protein
MGSFFATIEVNLLQFGNDTGVFAPRRWRLPFFLTGCSASSFYFYVDFCGELPFSRSETLRLLAQGIPVRCVPQIQESDFRRHRTHDPGYGGAQLGPDLFPIEVRYSGAATAIHFAIAIFGGALSLFSLTFVHDPKRSMSKM